MPKRSSSDQAAQRAESVYWQVSLQRMDDCQILLKAERTTGAVYLAGYAVECAMKAWILSRTPKGQKQAMVSSFRGNFGHNLESLKNLVVRRYGEQLPRALTPHFEVANRWNTEIRYRAGTMRLKDANEFLASVVSILAFIKMRLGYG